MCGGEKVPSMGVKRIGVSIPEELLDRFDDVVERRGYDSRSEALRDAVRDFIVEREWEDEGAELIGVVTLVYDHSRRGLESRLTEAQHEFPGGVDGSFHVHLSSDRCLEVTMLRGRPGEIRDLADDLSSMKGVKQVRLVTASPEEDL